MSQRQLAERVRKLVRDDSVPVAQTVQQWEAGDTRPSIDCFVAMAHVFYVPFSALIRSTRKAPGANEA